MSINPALRYQVYYTTQDKTPIIIPRSSLISDSGDVVFIGKNKLEYGEVFNANVLHLLENYACPEDPSNPGNPLLSVAFGLLLSNPTQGQIWFNKTIDAPYVWNGMEWILLGQQDTVAGNSGVIAHGQQIPRPVSAIDGYTYSYPECSWVVSPFGFIESDRLSYLQCYTDSVGRVFMQYIVAGELTLRNGYANYQIISVRDSNSHGVPFPTPNIPNLTPTPTGTPRPTPTKTPVPTSSPTPTTSRTPGPTLSATPTPTVTRTETPVPSPTQTPDTTPTRTPTPTPTVTPSRIPQWSQIEETCVILPVGSSTPGATCNPSPPPGSCSGGNLGTTTQVISECYIGAGQFRRCTRTFICTLQDICSP